MTFYNVHIDSGYASSIIIYNEHLLIWGQRLPIVNI